MKLHARGIGAAAFGVVVLLAACDGKDASVGAMNPLQGANPGSSGTDSIAGTRGQESSHGGTGTAPEARGGGTATGGGGGGGGTGAGENPAGGGAGAGAGNETPSGGDAGESTTDIPDATGLLAVSEAHACVIVSGKVYCWGSDLFGETGAVGSDIATPLVTVPGLESEMIGVAAADGHTCAVARSGTVYCWGNNDRGQLGVPQAQAGGFCAGAFCNSQPQAVPGIENAVEVAGSTGRTCARLIDGSVRCWGDVAEITDWAASVTHATSLSVAPGGVCVTTTAGTVACSFAVPADIDALKDARRVMLSVRAQDFESTGYGGFGCVLGAGGSVTCFGENTHGERGTGNTGPAAPLRPTFATGAVSIALGRHQACALGRDGLVQCWGVNTYGAVAGYPYTSPNCADQTCESSPRSVLGLPRVAALSAGGQTCALATDGTVWCWGGSADAYYTGAPFRTVGPWEGSGDVCVNATQGLASPRVFDWESECTTDADCIPLRLDLSCDHTCAVAGIARDKLASAQATLDRLELEACAPANAAGCPAPTVACPALTERAICSYGHCSYDAPERTGCTRRCDCDADRLGASLSQQAISCTGFDLQPSDVACDVCQGGGLNVIVVNTGTAAFDGDAVISFEDPSNSTPPVPDARTVTLSLPPGGRSAPIHFDSNSTANAQVRVTALGNCNTGNDATYAAAFPGPAQRCE